jgi:DNA-repair protein complementing XP-A cells
MLGGTTAELQDEELLPHLKRPNPHKATWNDMQLYLRFQVEDYAFSNRKWGSAEALDAEFERRADDRRGRKEKKFKDKLEELKKRTRTEAYRRNRGLVEKGSKRRAGLGAEEEEDGEEARFGMRIKGGGGHVHEWGRAVMNAETGVEVKRCVECGMECEEFEL